MSSSPLQPQKRKSNKSAARFFFENRKPKLSEQIGSSALTHLFDVRAPLNLLGFDNGAVGGGGERIMMYGGVNLMAPKDEHPFPSLELMRSLETTYKLYNVDPEKGYSDSQVPGLIEKYGLNSLEKAKRRTKLEIFVDQFKDLLVILLMIAALIAFGIAIGTSAHWEEFIPPVFIVLIILANAALGVQQEGKADDAVEALDNAVTVSVQVIRDGEVKNVNATHVFPGDIILVDLGGVLPADAQIITSNECAVEEKMFTGEPDAIKKGPTTDYSDLDLWARKNIVCKGCPVATGNLKAIVVGTGMNTRMGAISKLLNEVEVEATPLQQKLDKLGQVLGICSITISVVVFIIGVAANRGTSAGSDQPVWLQMLLIAVALTVAAVPEGLPVCTTIALAMGMKAMAKKNAIIKTLKSVETLGQASTICSDKTGTLTKGEMTCIAFKTITKSYTITGTGYNPNGKIVLEQNDSPSGNNSSINSDQLCVIAGVCNGAKLFEENGKWVATGNLTDRAMLVLSRKYERPDLLQKFKIIKENPFNSERKMMSSVVEFTGSDVGDKDSIFHTKIVAFVKGAPNFILDKCSYRDTDGEILPLTAEEKTNLLKSVDVYAAQGNRALALCYSKVSNDDYSSDNVERDLIYVGVIACMDPPREEVPAAIRKAQTAGVRVVMITGDAQKTAETIAKKIGIVSNPPAANEGVIDCVELRALGNDKAARDKLVLNTSVFSRAKPEDKIVIVEVLQSFGGVVAMTGDGVNDSPALKKADIGISMGITGTEAAKAAADMILTDDSFVSIVLAIEEGRRIYCNIQKFIYYILSTNISEVFVILAAVLIGIESPLVPVQILWLNLITDGLPALALANEGLEDHVMLVTPRSKASPIIDFVMAVKTFIHTIFLTALCEGTYIYGLYRHTGVWDGIPDGYHNSKVIKNRAEKGAEEAQTMTIYIIVFAELLRAYSSRSAYFSVFHLGLFSNMWMQYSVTGGVLLTLFVGLVPGLQSIFGMRMIDGVSWAWILTLSWLPFFLDEFLKLLHRKFFSLDGHSRKHKTNTVIPITPSSNDTKV